MSSPGLPALRSVADELEAAGAVACEDFVRFVSQGMVSADYSGLRPTDGRLEVYDAERGQRCVLETTSDSSRARSVFTAKVLELARLRGRQLTR